MFEKLLVTLDGSRFSARALPYAIEMAKRFGSEVFLLQVVNPTSIIPTGAPAIGAENIMASPVASEILVKSAEQQNKKNISKANSYLSRKLHEVTSQGVSGSYHTLLGEAGKTIIKFCKDESIDLVIVTTSGKSGLKRTFLGSVADQVIREPGIPVLAIRPSVHPAKKKK